jgi:hypothetical protein
MTQNKLARNNIILLICLLIIILFFPALSVHKKLIRHLIFTAIIVFGSFSLDFRPKTRRILIAAGAVTIFLTWLSHFFANDLILLGAFLSFFCFNVFITLFMIRHIFRSKQVTGTIIINSINCYLFIGLLGAALLAIAEILEKFVFRSGIAAINFAGSAAEGFHDYLYFSFVTLSTLGYGDITPVSSIAKSITLTIAVTGQLYLAILIAGLVGKFLSQFKKD